MQPNLKELYRYKYEGSREIDAITLLQSQIHFINALNLIQNKLYPTYDQKIEYLPSVEGSHELIFNIDWQAIGGLFQQIPFKEFLSSAKTSIEVFAELVKLKKALKGTKPENEVPNSQNIVNVNLGHHNTFNVNAGILEFYKKNPKIVDELINSFIPLEANLAVKGIEINGGNKPNLLSVSQEDFYDVTLPNPYIEAEEVEKMRTRVSVFVKTPDFYPKLNKQWKWVFLYNNRQISATITDSTFKEMINHGLRYGQGDRLIVDLKLTYKKDAALNAYVIRKYEITDVHNSIFRGDSTAERLL